MDNEHDSTDYIASVHAWLHLRAETLCIVCFQSLSVKFAVALKLGSASSSAGGRQLTYLRVNPIPPELEN
jgi:hypothetical protein